MPWFIRFCRTWWCLLPLFALSYHAHAAPDIEVAAVEDTDVIETREVVVSATKTPLPINHVTSAVEIIQGEQMQQRRLKTVAEALRWAQGLSVNQSGGPGTVYPVRFRSVRKSFDVPI